MPFAFGAAAEDRALPGGAADCARAFSGAVVGVPLWAAGGAVKAAQAEERVCDTRTVSVPVALGPFKPTQCGRYVVTNLASLQPLAELPMTSVATPLEVTVTGCPGGDAAAPAVTARAPKVMLEEEFAWSASLSHDAADPLVVKRDEAPPVRVSFIANVARAPARRAAALEGVVTLEAPAGAAAGMKLQSAAVAVYDGRATYTSAPLDCGAASKADGAVELPPRGTPVDCTYRVGGLAAADGLVLPVVVAAAADGADAAPAPAAPALYGLAGAERDARGLCADVGLSFQLLSGLRRAPWQPVFAGAPLRGGPDCGDGGNTHRFELLFGGADAGAVPCGDYAFDGSVTAVPRGDGAGDPAVADARFAVRVEGEGCGGGGGGGGGGGS